MAARSAAACRVSSWIRPSLELFKKTSSRDRTHYTARPSASLETRAGPLPFAFVGLGREKHFGPVPRQPARQIQFGISVADRRIDVVHPITLEDLEGRLDPGGPHPRQGGDTEKDAGAVEAGSTKGPGGNHGKSRAATLAQIMKPYLAVQNQKNMSPFTALQEVLSPATGIRSTG